MTKTSTSVASATSTAAPGSQAFAPTPVAVFQGYDSVTGRGLSTAVAGETKTVGGTSSVSYRVCTDIESLSDALEIDQSLSIGFGPVGSIDQKMRFVHNLKVTTYSVSIVVYARHTVGRETTTGVALKAGIKPPVGDDALRDFFRAYGDTFLSSCTRGGEYYAVYTFYSQTREEQSELTIGMKAHGIFEGGSVDAAFQSKIASFTSSTSTRSSLDQNISGILNPKFPPSSQIISFALDFPSLPLDAPAIIGFDTTGYEHVPGFGPFQPIAKNRKFFVGDGVVDGLTRPLVQIQELQNQIAWIQSIYGFYGGKTDAKLQSVGVQAKSDHGTINALIEAYQDDPIQAFTHPKLPSLDNGTPALAYSVNYSDAHGGNGGGPFDDVNVNTFIPQQTRITALQLRSGYRVDRLTVTYQNNAQTWTAEHGGNGGGLSNKLSLMPGQFVTQVAGRSGERVDHLTITASNGGRVDGGGGGGGAFDWTVPEGAFVLGFAGRKGEELDQIRVAYGSLQPAKWVARPD